MRQPLFRTVCLWTVLLFCALVQAQTASPYYAAPLQLTVDKAGAEATVGNVLCYSNRREFPNGNKNTVPDAATFDNTITDLKIGGSYNGDYWTFAVNAPEAGLYKFEFAAAHAKDGNHTLAVAQSADELSTMGETDENIAYTDVETLSIPNGNGNWHARLSLPVTMTLKQGLNCVKITFGGSSYCGNLDGLKVYRTYPPSPALSALTLGGKDILDDMDANDTYTINVPEGNPLPEVAATANELAEAEVEQATTGNMTATVKLYKKDGHELLKIYTVKYVYVGVATGYSFTWTTGDGTTDQTYVSSDGTYRAKRTATSNAAFSILGATNVYSDSRFKIKTGEKYALLVPANAKVESVTFASCYENYYNKDTNANTDSEWNPVTSGGTAGTFENGDASITTLRDIKVTFANHQAGTPIEFSVKKCAQTAFEKIIIAYSQINDHTLGYIGANTAEGEVKNVSGTLTLAFDREVSATSTAKVTIDNQPVRYQVKGSSLVAYYWDLTPSASHTLTLAANSVEDVFKNTYDKDIAVTFQTAAVQAVEMSEYDYVVASADELHTAVEAVNASNTAVDSPRKRIFVKNGDYVLDTTVKYENGQGKAAVTLTAHNVSIVGQSEDGVVLRSLCTNDGQGTAVLEVKGQNTYLQDLTLRTADFRTEQFLTDNTSYGRLLAVYVNGGQKTVMKHVTLQSNQDTYLCGHLGYHEDCTIHGTVDFIYAGGDNLFQNNTIVMENGGVIGAPATNTSQQWGLVFDACTIKAGNACYPEAGVTYEGYSLARPWQGEPRCYWLNTTMEILPADLGWRSMGDLITHFYEYNSMDKDGNKLDLSKRGNSPSSLNTYSPILTDAEAAEFNVHNILGGEDGWEPAKMTVQMAAPTVALSGNTLSWNSVENALGYVIYKDGEYLGNTTETTFEVPATAGAKYAVAAANAMGGLGEAAEAGTGVGIADNAIAETAVSSSAYYNAQGQHISAPAHGVTIRIDTMADGSRKVVKVNY